MQIISNPRIKLEKFKISNFRCIEDSDWININDITALVGANEAGKSSLLQALLSVNPGSGKIDLDITRDFPRDRLSSRRKEIPNLPVASGCFLISKRFLEIKGVKEKYNLPDSDLKLVLTRYYDKNLNIEFQPKIDTPLIPEVLENLKNVRKSITRKKSIERVISKEENQQNNSENIFTLELKKEIINEIDEFIKVIRKKYEIEQIFKKEKDRNEFKKIIDEKNQKFGEYFELVHDEIKELMDYFEEIINELQTPCKSISLYDEISKDIPVFIYFEDYNILDGEIIIPNLIKAIEGNIQYKEFRIQEALFKHVGLDPKEIYDLGRQALPQQRIDELNTKIKQNILIDNLLKEISDTVSEPMQQHLKLREILLDSASQQMTASLKKYYQDRKYMVDYKVDNQFLQILVSDDIKPSKINLSDRSKGFRWYFSFFLIFLVESDSMLQNSILLLDEPGIHLHLQAQSNLLGFFTKLADTNQILYTTHSPFLVDHNNLDQVRSVFEDEEGITKVTEDNTIADKKSIFPLQAALTYSTSQVIYQGLKQFLVEGDTDFNYIKGINYLLDTIQKKALSNDIVIIPCGSASKTELYSRLFIDLENLPVVLLDSDDEGIKTYEKLVESLYSGSKKKNVLQISDFVKDISCPEIEDLLGKDILVKLMNQNNIASSPISIKDLEDKPFVKSVQNYCKKNDITLKDNWKYILSLKFKKEFQKKQKDDILKLFNQDLIKLFEKLTKTINKNAQKKNPDFQFFEE